MEPCSLLVRPTRVFVPSCKMPARIPDQPGLTDHNAAEAEPALIQAVLTHSLARARQVSQSVDTRVKAVLQKCIAYDSRSHRVARHPGDCGSGAGGDGSVSTGIFLIGKRVPKQNGSLGTDLPRR